MTDAIEMLRRFTGIGRAHDESEFTGIGRAHDESEELRAWPGVRLAPGEQDLAGRIAGATDRIRDALAGRPGR